ncbi:MAG: hypothetical protein WA706_12305, partial [Pseudolabrys sp.]
KRCERNISEKAGSSWRTRIIVAFRPSDTRWQQTIENKQKINFELLRRARDYTDKINAKLKAAVDEEVECRIKERDRERRKQPLLLSSAVLSPRLN